MAKGTNISNIVKNLFSPKERELRHGHASHYVPTGQDKFIEAFMETMDKRLASSALPPSKLNEALREHFPNIPELARQGSKGIAVTLREYLPSLSSVGSVLQGLHAICGIVGFSQPVILYFANKFPTTSVAAYGEYLENLSYFRGGEGFIQGKIMQVLAWLGLDHVIPTAAREDTNVVLHTWSNSAVAHGIVPSMLAMYHFLRSATAVMAVRSALSTAGVAMLGYHMLEAIGPAGYEFLRNWMGGGGVGEIGYSNITTTV